MDIGKDEKDYLKNIGEMLMGRKVWGFKLKSKPKKWVLIWVFHELKL
jgi:hypothetical protein